jgi:hypothetical protein
MPQTILLRRGLSTNIGAISLNTSEPAFTTDTNKLYIGNGASKILINPDSYVAADKLSTARAIAISGDVTGTANFDGGSNVSIVATVVDDSHNHTISTVTGLQTALDLKSPLVSPAFTGIPAAPTATVGTNTTQLATTAFVTSAVSSAVSGTVATANKLTTARTIATSGDATGSVVFDGTVNVTIPLVLSSSGVTAGTYTKITVDAKGRVTVGANPTTIAGYSITDAVYKAKYTAVTDFNTLMTTGIFDFTVGSNTNAATTDTGRLVVDFDTAIPFQLWYPDDVNVIYKRNYITSAWGAWTNLISASNMGLGNVTNESKTVMFTTPTFTGTPVAPTAAVNTNTTQVATTQFVLGQVGTASPLVNGTVAVGTSYLYSRQDHVHPIDATRAPLVSPIFTGAPAAPTATVGTNTTQLATTAFVATTVANLVNTAPATLDTLNELATALGNDANFSTTMTNQLALKAPLASPIFTGTVTAPAFSGNATSTTKLVTARTIAISGDVTGTATSFDGTANISIAAIIATIDGGTF